jgi:hypothetical protein
VTGGMRALYKFRPLAKKVGVRPRGIDKGADLALTAYRTGKYGFPRISRGGQGFAGQCRPIHLDRIARQHLASAGHNITQTQLDGVTHATWGPSPGYFLFGQASARELSIYVYLLDGAGSRPF